VVPVSVFVDVVVESQFLFLKSLAFNHDVRRFHPIFLLTQSL